MRGVYIYCNACFVLLPLKPTARDLCLCATKSALQRLLKNRVHICQRHRQRQRRVSTSVNVYRVALPLRISTPYRMTWRTVESQLHLR